MNVEPKFVDRSLRSLQSPVIQRQADEVLVVEAPKLERETAESGSQTTPLREKKILIELLDSDEIRGEINNNRPDLFKEMLGIVSQRF